MLAASGSSGDDRRPERPDDQARRTIDTRVIRNSPDELLDAFDAPGGNASTLVATQRPRPLSLLLVNGEWALARGEAFATRLEHHSQARGMPGTEL